MKTIYDALAAMVDLYENGYPESDYAAQIVNEARQLLESKPANWPEVNRYDRKDETLALLTTQYDDCDFSVSRFDDGMYIVGNGIKHRIPEGPMGMTRLADAAYRAGLAASPHESSRQKLLSACKAVRARMRGEFDHPDLVAMGPLDTDGVAQSCEWLSDAILEADIRGRDVPATR